mgnify:CR=1 FL=1
MSMGYGGIAKKVAEDDGYVLYAYGAFNWNLPECANNDYTLDGSILIPKDCFIEPEIHEKIKKMPSGRKKLVTKRIINLDTIYKNADKALEKGLIKIENSRFMWKYYTDAQGKKYDFMALRLLTYAFKQYQETGTILEKIQSFT